MRLLHENWVIRMVIHTTPDVMGCVVAGCLQDEMIRSYYCFSAIIVGKNGGHDIKYDCTVCILVL